MIRVGGDGSAQRIIGRGVASVERQDQVRTLGPGGQVELVGLPSLQFDGQNLVRFLALVPLILLFDGAVVIRPAFLKLQLRRAISERASVLSSVKGLNPLVEESLVILAAGGLAPDRLAAAMKARADLYETMHENRVRRLVTLGFLENEARELSELHTPNFM